MFWVGSALRSKGINKDLFTIAVECLLSEFVFSRKQSIDYSMSDENLTLQRVETWTAVALKAYVKKCGLLVMGQRKCLPIREYVVRFSSLILYSMLRSGKLTKSDGKHSIAIVNTPLFIPFDLSADLTHIICNLAYYTTYIKPVKLLCNFSRLRCDIK